MPCLRPTIAALLLLGATACGSGASVDAPNPAIADQVNEAASNIGESDGQGEASINVPTPEDVGTAMRASGRERPGRHY